MGYRRNGEAVLGAVAAWPSPREGMKALVAGGM